MIVNKSASQVSKILLWSLDSGLQKMKGLESETPELEGLEWPCLIGPLKSSNGSIGSAVGSASGGWGRAYGKVGRATAEIDFGAFWL